MSNLKNSEEIRTAILELVTQQSTNISSTIAAKFNISRQAVHKHLKNLVAGGYLISKGATRNKAYFLGKKRFFTRCYSLKDKLEEHLIWEKDIQPLLIDLADNVQAIADYSVTEIVNNAIDHSQGETLRISIILDEDKANLFISILDDGEGIFKRITRINQFDDERLAILELSKGKLTTDPMNHTGQGIFFTSKAVDAFVIESKGLHFDHFSKYHKGYLEKCVSNGDWSTDVRILIKLNTDTELKSIFDKYSRCTDDYEFNRTMVPVKLVNFEGGKLISRSQAKRLLLNLDKFKYITLDFQGIEFIGQAFADQIFRVFQQQHPSIEIETINKEVEVDNMIRGAIANTITRTT